MKKYTQFILTSFLFLLPNCGSGIDSGEGKKIGQIVKIGEHGVFCKTYEAEIVRGGLNNGSGVNGLALDFTIKDKKLYEDLVKVMETQQEIELEYSRATLSGPCYSETGIFATGFKVLNKEEKSLREEPKEEKQKDSAIDWRIPKQEKNFSEQI